MADAILAGGSLTHYDRPRIAQLCEKAGLYMRALQHYTELTDIKRTLANTHAIPPQELSEFFGTLSAEWALECLKELLVTNATQNLQVGSRVRWLGLMFVRVSVRVLMQLSSPRMSFGACGWACLRTVGINLGPSNDCGLLFWYHVRWSHLPCSHQYELC